MYIKTIKAKTTKAETIKVKTIKVKTTKVKTTKAKTKYRIKEMRVVYNLKIHGLAKKIMLFFIFVFVLTGSLSLMDDSLINHPVSQKYEGRTVGDRIAFIIPGLNEPKEHYTIIEGYFEDVGITPFFIDMDWMKLNFDNLIAHGNKEMEAVIGLYPDRDIYMLGFSFGAIIALNTTDKFESKGTILCSLSPLFQEDMKEFPDWLKKAISMPTYTSIQGETTVFLYGDQDNSLIKSEEVVKRREGIYSQSEFVVIAGAEHDITGAAYLEQIKQEIYRFKEVEKNE